MMSFRAATVILVLGGSLFSATDILAAEPFELPLWQGIAPGSEGADAVVELVEERGDATHHDRKISGVTIPTITVHMPDPGINTGAALVLCPGGGYGGLAIDKEGHDIARYLNTIGVAGIVLKYRLPRPKGFVFKHDVPLQDAARAMRMIRHHAEEWNIDPERAGIMGFSAGGHLASTLATQYVRTERHSGDPIDQESARPGFQVLVYAVTSLKEGVGHPGLGRRLIGTDPAPELVDLYSNELQVTEETPAAFLVSTYDDHVKAENSLVYYQSLRANGVPAELHIYEVGGHGYGIRPTGKPVATWHHRLRDWMQQRGLLDR